MHPLLPALALVACPAPWARFERMGSEACWVRFRVGESAVCVPREIWREYLASSPTSLCGPWPGRWRARGRAGLEWRADALPSASAPPGRLERLRARLERWRERVSGALAQADRLGALRPLLLDERAPGAPAELLRWLGFVHVVGASGIHLYGIAAGTGALLRAGIRRAGRGHAPGARALGAVRAVAAAVWLVMWGLAGFRPGLARPLLVVLARAAALSLGLRWRAYAPLLLSLAIGGPGRWHYAFAVGGGLWALERASRRHAHLAMAWGSWLFTVPLDAWENGSVAWMTPVLSLLTVPLLASLAYPLLAVGAVLPLDWGEPLLRGVTIGISWVLEELASGAALGRSLWSVPPWAWGGGVVVSAALALLKSKFGFIRPAIAALTLCAIARLLVPGEQLRGAAREITQLDVGQGDSALVVDEGGAAGLIDAGSGKGGPSYGKWLSFLLSHGVTRLRWAAFTHLDEDHVGGLARLERLLPIACLTTSRLWLAAPVGRRHPFVPLESATCYPYRALPPDAQGPSVDRKNNAGMSAFLVPLADGRLYANAGDSDSDDEERFAEWLLRERGDRPLILKISHHGSRFSSARSFLERLRPEVAWISCGLGNRYGHPTARVLTDLASLGIPVRRTDVEGELRATTAAGGHRPRSEHRR